MAERRIGIDFGTSTTVIRVRRYEDGKALGDLNAVKFDGEDTIPTLIAELLNGNGCYFGKRAENMRHQSRQNRVILHSNLKLKLESPDPAEREAAKRLTAEFLKHLGDAYTHQSSFLGSPDDEEKTFISYPVKWGEETRAFMVKAAKDAGFPNVEGLDEAQACIRAVTEYCAKNLEKSGVFRSGAPCTILLIDMGAGTTDLVLCRYTPGTGETVTLSTWPKDGEMLFGGCEVDELLAAYIRGSFPEAASVQKLPGGKFKAWKDELVSPMLAKGETVDHFDALDSIAEIMADIGENFDPSFDPINRTKFEEITAAYLSGFPKLVNEALADAGLRGESVDLVILTGGHSQWYFVREMLLGRKPQFGEIRLDKIQADPARVVSLGLPQETVAQGLVVYHVGVEEMYNCGENYYYGRGVKQDYAEAAMWYRKAAEQGYAAAQFSLGWCYYNGQGVKQDYAEAVKWYRKAAEQGYADAQYKLGWCYYHGKGVDEDYHLAHSLFRLASDNGSAHGAYWLAVCYSDGKGVPISETQAQKYYKLAADRGCTETPVPVGYAYICIICGEGVQTLVSVDGDMHGLRDNDKKVIRVKPGEHSFFCWVSCTKPEIIIPWAAFAFFDSQLADSNRRKTRGSFTLKLKKDDKLLFDYSLSTLLKSRILDQVFFFNGVKLDTVTGTLGGGIPSPEGWSFLEN